MEQIKLRGVYVMMLYGRLLLDWNVLKIGKIPRYICSYGEVLLQWTTIRRLPYNVKELQTFEGNSQ